MKIHLGKIDKFYNSRLGGYVVDSLRPAIAGMIDIPTNNSKTCIISASAFAFINIFKNMKRLSLQAFHAQETWPAEGQGHYVVAERKQWPYRAEEVDYVVMVHDLEFAEDPDQYLREAWRVLKGEGRLVIVFPNRAGKWARFDTTPFGLGYPYTLEQMDKLLSAAHFSIDKVEPRLFHSPVTPETWVGEWGRSFIEKIGLYCLLQPGVYCVCASKHIYAPTRGLGATTAEKAKQALFPKPAATTPRGLNNNIKECKTRV